MIYINRTQAEPAALRLEREKRSGTYNIAVVVNTLKKDFLDKCYICEFQNPPSINIEHFIPHRNNHALKFDWTNLFFVCTHCNNIKLAVYDNILNCTDPKDFVEEAIKLRMNPFPFSEVEISLISEHHSEKGKQTVDLLNKVYNGHTPQKRLESHYIREELIQELLKFSINLNELIRAKTEIKKQKLFIEVNEQLHSASPFASFKRWILRDNLLLEQKIKDIENELKGIA